MATEPQHIRPPFFQRFFQAFLRPLQAKPDLRNREVVLTTLIVISVGMMIILLVLLVVGHVFLAANQLFDRITLCVGLSAFLLFLYWLARHNHYYTAARLLTLLYSSLAVGLTLTWGINLPLAILLFCFSIVLAGILLGSRYALYSTAFAIFTLLALQTAKELGWFMPNESWLKIPSVFGDFISSSAILIALGFVSWLYGHQNEQSLKRAELAERQLRAEQAELEDKIEKRTLELQVAQFKEMQQLYRFAEVGHLSAAMLHELANHLTVLTFSIDDLEHLKHSKALQQARQSVRHLEQMIERVSSRLHNPGNIETFSVEAVIQESVALFESKARDTQVALHFQPKAVNHILRGDPIQLSQILGVLIANAIEAYDNKSYSQREVVISTDQQKSALRINVVDYGPIIPKKELPRLFDPFYSTKTQGMGIGLFIAKTMVETNFKGSISVTSSRHQTAFTILLPYEQS